MSNQDLKFEIIQGHNSPVSKKFGEREVLLQEIYMHNGSAFPIKIILQHNNAHECLAVGEYTLDPSSFRPNQYGSLELDRFNLKFNPISTSKAKAF
jgi:hypothetical protein